MISKEVIQIHFSKKNVNQKTKFKAMNKAFKKLTMQMKVNLMTQILNREMNMKD